MDGQDPTEKGAGSFASGTATSSDTSSRSSRGGEWTASKKGRGHSRPLKKKNAAKARSAPAQVEPHPGFAPPSATGGGPPGSDIFGKFGVGLLSSIFQYMGDGFELLPLALAGGRLQSAVAYSPEFWNQVTLTRATLPLYAILCNKENGMLIKRIDILISPTERHTALTQKQLQHILRCASSLQSLTYSRNRRVLAALKQTRKFPNLTTMNLASSVPEFARKHLHLLAERKLTARYFKAIGLSAPLKAKEDKSTAKEGEVRPLDLPKLEHFNLRGRGRNDISKHYEDIFSQTNLKSLTIGHGHSLAQSLVEHVPQIFRVMEGLKPEGIEEVSVNFGGGVLSSPCLALFLYSMTHGRNWHIKRLRMSGIPDFVDYCFKMSDVLGPPDCVGAFPGREAVASQYPWLRRECLYYGPNLPQACKLHEREAQIDAEYRQWCNETYIHDNGVLDWPDTMDAEADQYRMRLSKLRLRYLEELTLVDTGIVGTDTHHWITLSSIKKLTLIDVDSQFSLEAIETLLGNESYLRRLRSFVVKTTGIVGPANARTGTVIRLSDLQFVAATHDDSVLQQLEELVLDPVIITEEAQLKSRKFWEWKLPKMSKLVLRFFPDHLDLMTDDVVRLAKDAICSCSPNLSPDNIHFLLTESSCPLAVSFELDGPLIYLPVYRDIDALDNGRSMALFQESASHMDEGTLSFQVFVPSATRLHAIAKAHDESVVQERMRNMDTGQAANLLAAGMRAMFAGGPSQAEDLGGSANSGHAADLLAAGLRAMMADQQDQGDDEDEWDDLDMDPCMLDDEQFERRLERLRARGDIFPTCNCGECYTGDSDADCYCNSDDEWEDDDDDDDDDWEEDDDDFEPRFSAKDHPMHAARLLKTLMADPAGAAQLANSIPAGMQESSNGVMMFDGDSVPGAMPQCSAPSQQFPKQFGNIRSKEAHAVTQRMPELVDVSSDDEGTLARKKSRTGNSSSGNASKVSTSFGASSSTAAKPKTTAPSTSTSGSSKTTANRSQATAPSVASSSSKQAAPGRASGNGTSSGTKEKGGPVGMPALVDVSSDEEEIPVVSASQMRTQRRENRDSPKTVSGEKAVASTSGAKSNTSESATDSKGKAPDRTPAEDPPAPKVDSNYMNDFLDID